MFDWVIVPAPQGDDPDGAIEEAASKRDGSWLKVTEYNRTPLRIVVVRVATADCSPAERRAFQV